jgi:hypothetical protein
MNEERTKILEMLKDGKITVQDAEKLLAALASGDAGGNEPQTAGSRPKYLRVQVEPGPRSESQDRVNIRVPMKLIRAGLKLAAFIPKDARNQVSTALKDKGIEADWDKITPEDLEQLVSQIDDLTVDIDGRDKVRIYCE